MRQGDSLTLLSLTVRSRALDPSERMLLDGAWQELRLTHRGTWLEPILDEHLPEGLGD